MTHWRAGPVRTGCWDGYMEEYLPSQRPYGADAVSPSPAPHPADDRLAIGYQPSAPEADILALDRLARSLAHGEERAFLSFPDHFPTVSAELAPLLALFVDHRRSPYDATPFDDATRDQETAVLRYFAALAGACLDEVDGHVSTSPRTALLHALALARRRLPDPSVYASEQAHHDVTAVCKLLGMNQVRVRTLPDGTMDPDDLRLQTRIRREAGALVVATCGTPLRGAVDDVSALQAAAAAAGRVHMHVDATAGALVAAHSTPVPAWSLAHGAHSITLSGHRLLGLPLPAAICLARREPSTPTRPATTFPATADPGNALAVLLLWTRLRSLGRGGVAALVARCQDVAAYAVEQLEAIGADPGRLPGSLAVTFARPERPVVDKWRLECFGDRAQITATGPVTHTAVDELAADLSPARRRAAA
ncbi:pyridoxal-dependent decarboxylase (plasmid) [Streptomyces sp. NBC_01281]|uniref:pyridoxal-dependent decarboxylase n=1 Tax=Streptomyces sp. NBC_01281 TaxID=2903811 RepID=UPI002E1680EB|nr:pyridoxal-dependent decarboxylase [Streptomyces sp. NBC_01281]WSK66601.1 pyridoxal-dependent decarboxylase [Streptomyces sp. NBC_01281]